MLKDARGLEVTAASAEAVAAFDRTVGAYLAFRADTGEHLKATLAADPEMALAHCLKGYFMMLFGTKPFLVRACKSLEAADAAVARRAVTAREAAHVEALRAWSSGDFAGAIDRWDAILIDYPRDVVALKLAQYGHFYRGDGRAMRDSLGRAMVMWEPSVAGYSHVIGSYAFALEEAGDYLAAERHGRRAVEMDPADVWAAHAVAHVMEMQGRQRAGVEWITALDRNWGACHNFVFHILWHRCLFLFELEQYDRVLDLYDREVRPSSTEDYLDISNAVALLWRLEKVGVEIGNRWNELAERSAAHIGDDMLVFADVHYMMALAAADPAGADRLLAQSRRFAETGTGTEAEVMREVGLALLEAIRADRAGDAGRVVDLLMPARRRLAAIGGSHAQRDVFEMALVNAALASGRFTLARALASERLERRQHSAWNWRVLAEAHRRLGNGSATQIALGQAARVLVA